MLIPASAGVQGPGETMMWLGASAAMSPRLIASLRTTSRGMAELADIAGEVPDEAVVIVDEQDHAPPSQRLDQGLRLGQRLLVLGRGIAVGDDAAAGLERDLRPLIAKVRMVMLVSIQPSKPSQPIAPQ